MAHPVFSFAAEPFAGVFRALDPAPVTELVHSLHVGGRG